MEEKLNIAKRTLLTRLYSVEQEIRIFEDTFPNEYKDFEKRITKLKQAYNYSLEEMRKPLTFEIDPETDTYKIGKVAQLEKDVKKFIDKDVRYYSISNRLQHLIKKLNILYNVSIAHHQKRDMEKVLSQVSKAKKLEIKLVEEFKSACYILSDTQMKERIIELLSYVDYETLKLEIRNSDEHPKTLISELVFLENFNEFDYTSAFITFIKAEINDQKELVNLISDKKKKKIFKTELVEILEKFTYFKEGENPILDIGLWEKFLNFESTLIEILKFSGVEGNKTKVKIIDKMEINVKNSEILIVPLKKTQISLIKLFSKTQDMRIYVLEKLIENMSENISYKEIYYLSLLFDVIEIMRNNSNELFSNIEKYIVKYPYDTRNIVKRKKDLINSNKKEYLFAFILDDNFKNDVIKILKKLYIDYKIVDNKLFINSFYFNNLKNVYKSLLQNTKSQYKCKNDCKKTS